MLSKLHPLLVVACIVYGASFCSFSSLLAQMPLHIEGDHPKNYRQILFLYERSDAAGQSEQLFRPIVPLYAGYKSQEKAFTFRSTLFPLWAFNGTNYWYRWNSFDLFTGEKFYHQDTGEDSDLFITLLYGYGTSGPNHQPYFSVFPFYGNLKNRLSWSDITYILWPIYTEWSYKDYKARSLLWPLTMRGKSRYRDDIRIFPFYSHKIHERKYKQYTVLWPFVQWGEKDIDKKDPVSYQLFWPFYGHKSSQSGDMYSHSILPIIIWPVVAWGGDKKTESFDLRILWFLYQYGRNESPYNRRHIVFPFYAYYRYGSNDDAKYFKETTFITPFRYHLRARSSVMDSDYRTLFPFYHDYHRLYHGSGETDDYFKIWPLFLKQKNSNGSSNFTFLALWPFHAEEFERQWSPIWSLYEYRKYPNSESYYSVLMRLFSVFNGLEGSRYFVLGFEYDHENYNRSFQFLGGLFGYGRVQSAALKRHPLTLEEQGRLESDIRTAELDRTSVLVDQDEENEQWEGRIKILWFEF